MEESAVGEAGAESQESYLDIESLESANVINNNSDESQDMLDQEEFEKF